MGVVLSSKGKHDTQSVEEELQQNQISMQDLVGQARCSKIYTLIWAGVKLYNCFLLHCLRRSQSYSVLSGEYSTPSKPRMNKEQFDTLGI